MLQVVDSNGKTPADVAKPGCAAVLKAAGITVDTSNATMAAPSETTFTPSYRANPKFFYAKADAGSRSTVSIPMATQPDAAVPGNKRKQDGTLKIERMRLWLVDLI